MDVIVSKTRANIEPYEFALVFYRGNESVPHEFLSYPTMDGGSLAIMLGAARAPERAIESLVKTIRKLLADDDGTPADFSSKLFVEKTEDDPDLAEDEQAEEPDDDAEQLYQGLHGEPITYAQRNELLAFDAGSSRRRFNYLFDEDDSLVVEIDQLRIVYKKLLAKASARPTGRRS